MQLDNPDSHSGLQLGTQCKELLNIVRTIMLRSTGTCELEPLTSHVASVRLRTQLMPTRVFYTRWSHAHGYSTQAIA